MVLLIILNNFIYYKLFDNVTRLFNRDYFLSKLKGLSITKRKVAVTVISISQFSQINTLLGYKTGDDLLRYISIRITRVLGMKICISRLYSDKFGIILVDVKNKGEVELILNRLLDKLKEPYYINGVKLELFFNIGCALNDTINDYTELLLRAETSCTNSKKYGFDYINFFDNISYNLPTSTYNLNKDFKNALLNKEFFLVYQPIYNIKNQKIESVEVLLRWLHPTLGVLNPVHFIDLAEQTGIIVPLGNWLIKEACKFQKLVKEIADINLTICINLSYKQISNRDFVNSVKKILNNENVSGEHLNFEITETVSMQNPERLVLTMKQLEDSGIKMSIDDFGSGYSSFKYLLQFKASTLKVDKLFVDNLNSEFGKIIFEEIITLGKKLNMKIVAEGVESGEQFKMIKNTDCDYVQGYFISKPITSQELIDYLIEIKENQKY
jgi:diguanylate cyclase (GGDEF)-like protein